MTTCNNVILAQPEANTNVNYTIPEGDSARLNFTPDQISGLQMGENGELVVSFNDGGQLTITNFAELADSGNLVYLADGTFVDPAILTTSAQTPDAFTDVASLSGAPADSITIKQPEANTTQEISIEQGMKYVCDFNPANAATVETKNGQMVLTFADGSQVIINNYETAMAGELPPEMTVADGTALQLAELTEVTEATESLEIAELLELSATDTVAVTETIEAIEEVLELTQESVAEQVANVEPAAGGDDLAEALANIETAAGEESGSTGNSGYGFNSTATDVPLNSPDAIGPLGATNLSYNAPQVSQENFIPTINSIPTISFDNNQIDETDLVNGNITVTGQITATYGVDTPGAITTTGVFDVSCPEGQDTFTSGGIPIIVTSTSDGYVGTTENGDTVFTFAIDPVSGEYTYEQSLPIDHPNSLDPNDEICINLGIQATDNDGDSRSSSVQITIADDGPIVLSQAENMVDETNLNNGEVSVSGQFEADMGQDIGGHYAGNDCFEVNGSLDNGTLTSNGHTVTVSYDSETNTYTAAANGETIFTLEVNVANGEYTYTQFSPLDHADPNDPNDIINLDFGIQIIDFDGDTADGKIRIQVLDDAPVANDDCQMVNSDTGEATGNVVTGLNGGAGATDNVGEGSTVTSITFDGETTNVPQTGTVSIEGDHGVLIIAADGTYTYQANDGVGETTINTASFTPSSADVSGTQNSISKDGITIRAQGDKDLSWFSDTNLGSGVGITGGSDKVYGDGEELEILLENAANSISITLGDMGENNIGSTFTYEVYLEGSTTPIIQTVTIDSDHIQNGEFTFEVSELDGDISRIDLVGGPSYVLNGVTATTVDTETVQDEFNYTITDSDGDTSSANLKLVTEPSDDFNPININGVGATDDTNLVNGDDVATGLINVDYQGDGPGTTAGNGSFTSSGNQTNNQLSSNGIPVNVTFNAGTNTYTGTASGQTVFTMVINDNGTYKFTQNEPLDHSNVNNNNEALFLNFGVTATDSDGDTGTGTVRITVRDDAPEANDDVVTLDNDDNRAIGNVLTNDDKGADDGTNVMVTTPGTYQGTYGTLVLNTDGSYTYTRNGQQGGTDTFDYTMKDHDGDTSTATLTVNVADDLSPIEINGSGATDDTDVLADGSDVVNGTINVNYQGDGPGTTAGNGSFTSSGQELNNTLTSNGVPVNITFNAGTNTYTGTAGGQTVFTMVINDNGTYKFTQNEPLDHSNVNNDNEALFLDFGVTATDSDGDTGTGTVRITVRDDAPEASDDTGATTYTSTNEVHCFDPTISDVAGTQNSITQDGITLTASNGGDLAWFSDAHLGSGVGIAGGSANTNKVYGNGESLNLNFAHTADTVTIELGDMGSNNIGNVFAYTVHLVDGSSIEETITIDGTKVNNGIFEFNISGYNSEISNIDLIGGPSFVLHGVKSEYKEFELTNAEGNVLVNDQLSADDSTLVTAVRFDGQDYAITNTGTTIQTENGILRIASNGDYRYEATNSGDSKNVFTYTITDADGDTSTAKLIINSEGVCTLDHPMDTPKFEVHLESFDNDDFERWDFSDTYNVKYYGAEKEIDFTINVISGENAIDYFTIEIPDVLSNFDIGFNRGTEIENGVWQVSVNDISGLQLTLPGLEPVDGKTWKNPDYRVPQGKHEFDVTAHTKTASSEHDCDNTIDSITVEANIEVTIFSSPLVLDLDGDGIELLNIENGVQFDMDQDGEVEQTGWVGADDAFLALDKNNDGIINDRSELFGDTDGFSDGFAHLENYDSNSDGIIDSNDVVYEDLKVWQDKNSDGVSGKDEMLSLMDIGVVSIFLNADMPEDLFVEGSWISHTSTFLTDNGEAHDIVDAWFETRELSETELGAIEEAADTLLSLRDAGDDPLDISQMLETNDDITEAIQDFVHNTENNDNENSFTNDNNVNVEQNIGLSSASDLEELPQSGGDQIII